MVVGRKKRVGVNERPSLSAERKAEVVEAFLASGKTIAEVAQEYRLTERTVRDWIQEAADEVSGKEAASQETDPDPQGCAEPGISSAEYRAQVVAWYLSSEKTIAEAAYALNLPESTVREWVWYATPDDVPGQTPLPHWATEAANELDRLGRVPEVFEQEFGNEGAGPELTTNETETAAQAEIMAARAEAAEAVARAEAKATAAVAAAAEARALAQEEVAARMAAEAATRDEIAAAYAAAVEAMLRTEATAAETVARAEAAAAEAVARAQAVGAEAEAAAADALARSGSALVEAEATRAEIATRVAAERTAKDEIAAIYAEAAAAVIRAEAAAAEKVAQTEAAAAKAVSQAQAAAAETVARSEATLAEAVAQCEAAVAAVDAEAVAYYDVESCLATEATARKEVAAAYSATEEPMERAELSAAERMASIEAAPAAPVKAPTMTQEVAAANEMDRSVRADSEAAARAEIAQLVSHLAPVEVWVQATGRTLAEAREAVLVQLGVNEADAEIEVLSRGSRWLPGVARVRARVRLFCKSPTGLSS